jgi:NAD(P)-dependent dehydrogenase (short-subunit alcohol dehydrogenase family)
VSTGLRRSRRANAVVTGAGSGIGRAFAFELAARGGRVVCSDIDEGSAQATAEIIGQRGGSARAARCDVSSESEVHGLAAEAQSWFAGPPTMVVNNAGVGIGGTSIGQTPLDDWRWALAINLWGPIHGCHVFVPLLRAAGYGAIINVASAASFGAAPQMAPYNVSKAGVLALSETLAAELSGTGVHVSVLCPTFVKTNIVEAGRITKRSTAAASTLMRVTGMTPERVARICLDTSDRGGLYVLPQVDAKVMWRLKRHAPSTYTRVAGLAGRIGPFKSSEGA